MTRKAQPVRPKGRSRAPFYAVIAVIAGVGVFALMRSANQPRRDALELDAVTLQSIGTDAPSGYLLGDSTALRVQEFADFECNACMNFATITEPDIRQRLVNEGLISFEYFFFPLDQHPNAVNAAHAAACADDQGKFWEMHDAIFHGYNDWALRANRDPRSDFARYAGNVGMDVREWEACYNEGRHRERILAHKAYALRLGVRYTPSFLVQGRLAEGAPNYDNFKAMVDEALARAQAENSELAEQ